ncbi:MAG: MotA/TolQ/ExbB proton channel family protein [Fuerstiella sp.]|nr:MotA/TolQ/ExbB proton channel family protein [Fuerstiella sp.]
MNLFYRNRISFSAVVVAAGLMLPVMPAVAQETGRVARLQPSDGPLQLTELVRAGGGIGYLIGVLSLVMVALIIDHVLNIRRSTLMPPGLAEEVHRLLSERNIDGAKRTCEEHPGFLSRLLTAGLDEVGVGYGTIEKSMEDAAVEQSARLFRRIEYLSVIGTIVPMLGLMGTVWGMIQAFVEFEQKANPQVSELAPGIYRALVTTLLGLGVAVPSLSAFAIFRNRIDELSAEATLLAEHVFADFRRLSQKKAMGRTKRTDVTKPVNE